MFRNSLGFLLELAILDYFVVIKAYERLENMSYDCLFSQEHAYHVLHHVLRKKYVCLNLP